MYRYNHRVLEKKWLVEQEMRGESSIADSTIYTALSPTDHDELDLENARLLILADFFGYLFFKTKPEIAVAAGKKVLQQGKLLGLKLASPSRPHYSLALMPRDYPVPVSLQQGGEKILIGRFHGQDNFQELYLDFGCDALRIYFLQLGPPERDYTFSWDRLPGAYRFVQKVWSICQKPAANKKTNRDTLLKTEQLVFKRLANKKPHTALAAIMGFLGAEEKLNPQELICLAHLLKPYTPFLASEIFSLYGGDPKLV